MQGYEEDDSSWKICNWASNVRLKEENLEEFHQQIERNPERPWFAQWYSTSHYNNSKSGMSFLYLAAKGKLRDGKR